MTSRAGEPFDTDRAAAEVAGLLTAPVPADGPTTAEGDPVTEEWTVTAGAGFRIVPLWEGDPLTGVYAPEWNDAEEAAASHVAELARALDARWGPHHRVRLDGPLMRRQGGSPVEPLFEALFSQDLYGDLEVWGPLDPGGRWVGLIFGHSDGDAPFVLAALVSDRPIPEPADVDGRL
ncbi:hypothetical protein SGL43_00228 [Streptomyces globisporus]|uniref:Uncharacterized protein n=1 Tax=Streptomyces globisporus TaxID=1908 RepID=A0ABM9GPD4_STRGL|nr:hypothetical protein [Streptomyces globisporus]CAH9413230.1 hypothetical protein SGL43_00228 [Streptomyces globisporus]